MLSKIRENGDYRKARKRLDKVSTGQVQSWADSAFWIVQSYLDDYRTNRHPAALREAKGAMVGLLAAIDSLLDRADD